MNIDELIKEYREAHPIGTGPLVEGEYEMLQRRVYHLTSNTWEMMCNTFQTEDAEKVKNFIQEELKSILIRMDRDETTILWDLLGLLVQEDIVLQKEIMNQAMDELGK